MGGVSLALAAFYFAGAARVRAQNLVPNGGFESGFTGWSNNTSGGAVASYSLEKSLPYAGAQAMKIAITNPGAQLHNVQTLGPTFALAMGTSTTITFRARATTAGAKVRFVMQNNIYNQREFALSTSWQWYVWNHATTEANPRLRIQYRSASTIWLDEISVVANPAPPAGLAITPNPGLRHQIMDGVGGALTYYSDRVLSLTATKKAAVEKLIFDDLGLDVIRLKNEYYPSGYPTNKAASGGKNKAFYDMAKKNGRDIKILLSSWSPPESLKSNNSRFNGGTLKKNASGQYVYADFAQYWVDLLDNLATNQWMPDFLSIQNEPGWVAAHETCEFAKTQTSTLAGYAESLDAIHNRIKDRPNVPILVGLETESKSKFLDMEDPLRTRGYLGVNAFHNYGIPSASTPDAPTAYATNHAAIDSLISRFNQVRTENALHGGRPSWMSEYSKGAHDWLDTAHVIHNTFVEANASAYLFWKLVWGNSTNFLEHMISIDSGNYIVKNTYWGVMHFSKEISRGDQRFEVTGSNTNVRISGYINPAANKITLVALNIGTSAQNISLRLHDLPIASATAFQTKEADNVPIAAGATAKVLTQRYHPLGPVDYKQTQTLPAESITTYVINLADTLNPYNPALLRVNRFEHQGNHVSVTIPSQPGHDFILWKSTTLDPGSWQEVSNAVRIESDGELTLTDPTPSPNQSFYIVQRSTAL